MAQTAVGTTAVKITTITYSGWVRNAGSNSVFLGKTDAVTTGNGCEFPPGEWLFLDSIYWAIAAAGGERIDSIT